MNKKYQKMVIKANTSSLLAIVNHIYLYSNSNEIYISRKGNRVLAFQDGKCVFRKIRGRYSENN